MKCISISRKQSEPVSSCSSATRRKYRRIRFTSRPIHLLCNPCATATAAIARYGAILQLAPTKQRTSAMMAHVMSEGRLFSLKPFDWAVLLVGMTLCGALTSLF